MKNDVRKIVPSVYLDYLNALITTYCEKYQDIPLSVFFKMEIDPFYEDLLSKYKPRDMINGHIDEMKKHLVSFYEERASTKQKHVLYPLRYISAEEFYWSISEFYFRESESVSRKYLFTKLLHFRHQVLQITLSCRDLTLNNGQTYFSNAVHGIYEKYGNRFGTNGHLFYPDDQHITVYPVLSPLYESDYPSETIAKIESIIEKEFEFYDVLNEVIN